MHRFTSILPNYIGFSRFVNELSEWFLSLVVIRFMNSANFLRSARNENRIPTQIVGLGKFCTDGAECEKSSAIWCGHRGLLQACQIWVARRGNSDGKRAVIITSGIGVAVDWTGPRTGVDITQASRSGLLRENAFWMRRVSAKSVQQACTLEYMREKDTL